VPIKKLFKPSKIRARTQRLREKFIEAGVNLPSPDDTKAERIGRAIVEGDFGCRTDSVFKLVEVIIGEPIPRPADNEDSDGYTPHKVGALIVYDGATYLIRSRDSDGDLRTFDVNTNTRIDGGDYLGGNEDFRPATEDETEAFLIAAGFIDEPNQEN
jgi:hypothetical protein